MSHPIDPKLQLALKVLDLSVGGCGLHIPTETPPLPAGVAIENARLDLDLDTRVTLALRVRHTTQMLDDAGEPRGVRLSCEWQGLSGPAERALQLYVDNLQKRARMLAAAPR